MDNFSIFALPCVQVNTSASVTIGAHEWKTLKQYIADNVQNYIKAFVG
jgi:hypothetical protein